MNKLKITIKSVLFFLIASILPAQVKIIQLPPTGLLNSDLNRGGRAFRQKILLDKGWFVYKADSPEKRTKVRVPFVFENTNEIVLEREFDLAPEQKGKNFVLHVFGLNYSADFVLNDVTVYRHSGGKIPIAFKVPSNVLNFGGTNTLKIQINFSLASEITVPSSQRFLFPKEHGGILGDVYLSVLPPEAFGVLRLSTRTFFKKKESVLKCRFDVLTKGDSTEEITPSLKVVAKVSDLKGNTLTEKSLSARKENLLNIRLKNIELWTPQKPARYALTLSLYKGADLLDFISRDFAVYDLNVDDKGIFLNGKPFRIYGTIYSPPDFSVLDRPLYVAVKRDLKIIRESGFNLVRFKYSYPQPFELELCNRLGLVPVVEIPLQFPPDVFLEDPGYVKRVKDILKSVVSFYSQFENFKILGLGSSYLNKDATNREFLASLIAQASDKGFLKFASFVDFPNRGVEGLDLYGMEIYAGNFRHFYENVKKLPEGKRIFISEISYPRIYGKTNGYLNDYSVEAQAKYFKDVIITDKRNDGNGFVLNAFYDYRGDYASFYAGYDKENIYKLGLVNELRDLHSYSLKIITASLTGKRTAKIPIGTKNNRSPILFVLAGLILGVIMGLLFNSKRQFREDATRALLRPYNFFADIRDHRILSGVHTFLLMLVLAGAHALLITIILYFLRMNILLEKILLAFDLPWLIKSFSYLAWHPLNALFILFLLSVLLFFFLAGIIKLASLSVKQIVYFSNIYFVVVWSFLPLTILLPVELVLHKILLANVVNVYVYVVLAFFFFWILKRLLRGVYVIFDVAPVKVYLWGTLLIFVLAGILAIYFQSASQTLTYIASAFSQHPVI